MPPHRRAEASASGGASRSSSGNAAAAGARKSPVLASRKQAAAGFQRLAASIAVVGLLAAVVLWRLVAWHRTPTAFAAILEVPRLDGTRPDAVRVFFERFYNRQPVVIEGVLEGWPAMQWSPVSLAERCPDARLPVYRYNLDAADWAALEDAGEPLLAEYLSSEFGVTKGVGTREVRYGLEMAMRNECPALLEDIRIPAFFADDMLVHDYKKAAWPTLIVGPQGTRSGLHRDTHNLPFWMALFAGRKRWRIFDPSEPALEPYYHAESNSFKFDAFAPDFGAFPGLGLAQVFEHYLEAGQLMYIPSGAPHAAYNVEDTIAISGNYLDPRGLDHHYKSTCQQPLWAQSTMCWFHNADFARRTPAPWETLREHSYFEFAGFSGPADWCDSFSPDLVQRAKKRAELSRCVPIVEAYCSGKKRA